MQVIFSCENTTYMWWQAELLHYTYVKVGMKAPLTALVSGTNEPARRFSSETRRVTNYKYYLGTSYPCLNKPGAIAEWAAANHDMNDTVLIIDPDSAFVASVHDPGRLPQGEAYAEAHDYMACHLSANRLVLERHCAKRLRETVQPVGIYMLINTVDLARLAPVWLQKTIDIRSDRICRNALPDDGWVSDMWGYAIAAAEVGVRHHIAHLSQPTGSNNLKCPITHYCYPLTENQDRIWTRNQHKAILWSKWSYQPWEPPPTSVHTTVEGRHLLNSLAALAAERNRHQ